MFVPGRRCRSATGMFRAPPRPAAARVVAGDPAERRRSRRPCPRRTRRSSRSSTPCAGRSGRAGRPRPLRLCWSPSTMLNSRHDDQTIMPRAEHRQQRRDPADPEVADVVLEGDHGASDHLPQSLDRPEPRRQERRDDPAEEPDQQRDDQADRAVRPAGRRRTAGTRAVYFATSTTSQSSLQPNEPSSPPSPRPASPRPAPGTGSGSCRSRSP